MGEDDGGVGEDDGALVLVLVELEEETLLLDEIWTTGSEVDTALLSMGLLIVCEYDGVGDGTLIEFGIGFVVGFSPPRGNYCVWFFFCVYYITAHNSTNIS